MRKITILLCLVFLVFNSCEDENLNEAPVINTKQITLNLEPQSRSSENQSIGIIEAYDIDGDELTFSILEQSIENAISVNENSGELFLNNCCVGSGDVTEIIELTVSVSDGNLTTEDFIIIDLEED